MDAVLEDWTTADIPARLRAALRLIEAQTLHPHDIDAAFVDGLRADGLSDRDIEEAANVGFRFNMINRLADAFDFPMPDERQTKLIAAALNRAVAPFPARPPSPSWTARDGVVRPVEIDAARAHMLTADGFTSEALRRGVEAFVVAEWGVVRPGAPAVPEYLHGYLRKLAKSAYKIIDDEVDALREAGLTDAQIHELSYVGAAAAATVGLEHLFGAMHAPRRSAA